MVRLDHARQVAYQARDVVLELLHTAATDDDTAFASQRWLLESLSKRMIYYHLYGDLLHPSAESKRVLDVGGGYTALTRQLVAQHDYTLLDLLAHDSAAVLQRVEGVLGRCFWEDADWYEFPVRVGYDVVVANDLFPNVDQRLAIFLERYLPVCREIRLSLTYYNSPRWYRVKRTDADEVFHMLAWDGAQVRRVLEGYRDRIEAPDFNCLLEDPPSLFGNGRQVCLVVLRGNG